MSDILPKNVYVLNNIVFLDAYFILFSHPPTRIVYLNFDCEPILPQKQGESLLALALRSHLTG